VCSWLANPGFGPEWKPAVCRMVVTYTPAENEIVITCDPSFPDVWRRKAYLQQIRKWAVEGRPLGARVIVYVGKNLTMVAPEGEFPIGELRADEAIASEFVDGRLVRVWATKKGGDDARDASAPTDPKPAG
jgi:hypothetical protein